MCILYIQSSLSSHCLQFSSSELCHSYFLPNSHFLYTFILTYTPPSDFSLSAFTSEVNVGCSSLSLRLRIKPSPGKRRSLQQYSSSKRAKSNIAPSVSSTSAGYIQIVDVDPSGRYIQINNTSDKVCTYVCPYLHTYIHTVQCLIL